MQIASGTSLAHYEIIELLGKGGMGEVYRAKDTKLGRDVAIKVLPEEFTKDRERLGRFEREARLLAALDHPRIASIYGIEEVDGIRFLVMQLAEGEDLSRKIARSGAIPVDEAIEIAIQIADALEAAHEKGIVHRDLKPANVMVDDEGRVKVLDFGLAKAFDSEEGDENFADSPTMVRVATHAGVILGTAAYMSPEQARGKRVDRRGDIWAFGAVLWEMLTGQRLFEGETVSDTLASVLKEEPDWDALPDETPSAVRHVLHLCLQKHPRERLHDVADARILIASDFGSAPAGVVSESTAGRSSRLGWLAALLVVGLLGGLLGYLYRGPQVAPPEPRVLAIQLPADQELVSVGNSCLRFSPDGRSVMFIARSGGVSSLYLRRLDEAEATPIPGTEGAGFGFFSPDGAWIGLVANGRLSKIPAEGGRPYGLGTSLGAGGATWMRDGTIVFAPIYSDGLFRMSSEGGASERITTPDRESGELGHWWPEELPGRNHVIFTAFRTPVDQSRIGAVDLSNGEIHWLVEGGFGGRWSPTGHLLFAKGQRLYAIALDSETMSTSGSAVAMIDDLRVFQTGGYGLFDVSSRGDLAWVTQSLGDPPSQVVWIARDGDATPAIEEQQRYLTVSLSPDDRHAAVSIQGDARDLWTYSFARSTLSRLTSSDDTEFDPHWSSDGSELFYVVDRPPFELHRITFGIPDSGRPVWDETPEQDHTLPAVSPDGRHLAYRLSEHDTGSNVYLRPIDGSEPPRSIRARRAQEEMPTFSPDGRWIAYQSDETGRNEIYVERFSGEGPRVQVTSDGGIEPLWASSGELFYRRKDEMRIVVTRTADDRFEFDPPILAFTHPIVSSDTTQGRTFDVTSDGSRVIAISVPEAQRSRRIELVTDWTTELARRVPSGD
jgi:Tol biopolymer transport system component